MKALVSRRNCLLVLRRRACVRLSLLIAFLFGPFTPQPTYVSVSLAGVPAVQPGEAAGVVPDPVLWPSPEDKASAIAAYSQPVSWANAKLTKQMGRQSY